MWFTKDYRFFLRSLGYHSDIFAAWISGILTLTDTVIETIEKEIYAWSVRRLVDQGFSRNIKLTEFVSVENPRRVDSASDTTVIFSLRGTRGY